LQRKERTGRVSLSKLYHPTSERKCLLFIGEVRGSALLYDKMHVQNGCWLGSPGVVLQSCMFQLRGLFLWWSEKVKE
jgi:hypothetical protein